MMCNLHGVPTSLCEYWTIVTPCTPHAMQQGEVGHLAVIFHARQFGCPKAAILGALAISCSARPRYCNSNILEL